jgi:hypothetical protein
MPSNEAPNLYLRDGSYLTGKESFRFQVKRDNFQKAKSFYRIYNLSTDCDWLLPVQKKTYIRNDQTAVINVSVDKSKMKTPGLYCGKIRALRDDKTHTPEFDMIASVIIPYEFNSSDNYKHEWKKENINGGILKRYFFKLPAGQTSMHLSVNCSQNEYGSLRYYLCNPEGNLIDMSPSINSVTNANKIEKEYYSLEPGIYELVVAGAYTAASVSIYDLSISFNSIQRIDNTVLNLKDKNIEIINAYNQPCSYSVQGFISGYFTSFKADLDSNRVYKYPFTFKKGETEKTFTVILSKDDFNKTTDFTYEIVDSSGYAVSKGGLDYRIGEISYSAKGSNQKDAYNLLLIPAFTNASDDMTVTIKEETEFENPFRLRINENSSNLTLYPSIAKSLVLDYAKPDVELPGNSVLSGKLLFQSSDETVYELPVSISPKD